MSRTRDHIFLCHAKEDKDRVRELHRDLCRDGFKTWFDEEDLLPGQKWRKEIENALPRAAVVIVCLSSASCKKEGYVQREIRMALDAEQELPEGTIYIIPAKLEECPLPDSLADSQAANLHEEGGYDRLKTSLMSHALVGQLWQSSPDTPSVSAVDPAMLGRLYEEFEELTTARGPSLEDFVNNLSVSARQFNKDPTLENAATVCAQTRAAFAMYFHVWQEEGRRAPPITHQFMGAFDEIESARGRAGTEKTLTHYLDSISYRKSLLKTLNEKGADAVKNTLQKQIRVIKQPRKG